MTSADARRILNNEINYSLYSEAIGQSNMLKAFIIKTAKYFQKEKRCTLIRVFGYRKRHNFKNVIKD